MRNAVLVIDVEEAAFRTSKESRVVGDGISFGGSVDDTEHLLEMGLH